MMIGSSPRSNFIRAFNSFMRSAVRPELDVVAVAPMGSWGFLHHLDWHSQPGWAVRAGERISSSAETGRAVMEKAVMRSAG
jgi:hypothetical protein